MNYKGYIKTKEEYETLKNISKEKGLVESE